MGVVVVTISQVFKVNLDFALDKIEVPICDLFAVKRYRVLIIPHCEGQLLFEQSTPGKFSGRTHVDNDSVLLIRSQDLFLGKSLHPGAQQVVFPGSKAYQTLLSLSDKFTPSF